MANRGATPVLVVAVTVRPFLYATLEWKLQHKQDKRHISCVCLVLQLTLLFMFAPCDGANVKIGVPENYNGIFPWYLAKVRHVNS